MGRPFAFQAGGRARGARSRHLGCMAEKLNKNEGEGNKTADKQYREAASDFAKRTDTLQAGLEAERDVEKNKPEFEKAEKAGRSHSAGDLPQDLDKK